MQGNLKEIDVASLLQLLEIGQRSGTLWVETDLFSSHIFRVKPNTIAFNCFFVNGKITYANLVDNSGLARLLDYLHPYKLPHNKDDLLEAGKITTNIPEYDCLWLLFQKQIISFNQVRTIIQKMIQETLFELVSIKEGFFYFGEYPLLPEITSVEITPLLKKIMPQLKHWKEFYPYIKSPNQCPVIKDGDSLREFISAKTYKRLSNLTDGKTSFSQLARYLNQDCVTIGQAMYPHIQKGWLSLIDSNASENLKTTQNSDFRDNTDLVHIIAINHDSTTLSKLNSLMEFMKFKLTLIAEPLEAFSIIFKSQPDLIMCNLPLEEIDGYSLCNMIKICQEHRHIPWIMLVNEQTFQQRLRGQLLGVTDFLTSSFDELQLLNLIDKHLSLRFTDEY